MIALIVLVKTHNLSTQLCKKHANSVIYPQKGYTFFSFAIKFLYRSSAITHSFYFSVTYRVIALNFKFCSTLYLTFFSYEQGYFENPHVNFCVGWYFTQNIKNKNM